MDSKLNHAGTIGELSELAVLYKLRKMGYEVFKSTCTSSRIDFLIHCSGDRFSKIQVKTVRLDKSKCKIMRIWGGYSTSEADFYIGVFEDSFYIVANEPSMTQRELYLKRSDLERWGLLPSPFGSSHELEVLKPEAQGRLAF